MIKQVRRQPRRDVEGTIRQDTIDAQKNSDLVLDVRDLAATASLAIHARDRNDIPIVFQLLIYR